MAFMRYGIIFVLGTLIGSWFHRMSYQYVKGAKLSPIAAPCIKCGTQLKFPESIPVFSAIYFQGVCRSCGAQIPFSHWFWDVLMGVLFIIPVVIYGESGFLNSQISLAWIFSTLLFTITLTDLYDQLIPNCFLLFFGSLLFLSSCFSDDFSIIAAGISALASFGFLYFIAVIGQRYYQQDVLGGGDIKLYILIGYVLGWKLSLVSLFFAAVFALCGAYGLKKSKRTTITFGPFIALSAMVLFYIGDALLQIYYQFF